MTLVASISELSISALNSSAVPGLGSRVYGKLWTPGIHAPEEFQSRYVRDSVYQYYIIIALTALAVAVSDTP